MQDMPDWDDDALNKHELGLKYQPDVTQRSFEDRLQDIMNLKRQYGRPLEGPPVIEGSSIPGEKGYFNPKICDPCALIQQRTNPYAFTEQISPIEFSKLIQLTNFMDIILNFDGVHPKFEHRAKFERFVSDGASVEYWAQYFSDVLKAKIYSRETIIMESETGSLTHFVSLIIAESKETLHICVLLNPVGDDRGLVRAYKLYSYHIIDFQTQTGEMDFEMTG